MNKAEELIKKIIDERFSGEKVYRDEPLLFTASQMKSYTPPEYREMRKLETSREAVFLSDAEIFFRQAKLMESFEDRFDYRGEFMRYFPTYRAMTGQQLRGYFSWRTALRRGEIKKTSLSFAFVYIYELINLVGVSSPEDGYRTLKTFIEGYKPLDPGIEPLATRWLRDFAIYYGLNRDLAAVSPDFKFDTALLTLAEYKSHTPEEVLCALDMFSSYRLCGSAFYKKYPEDTAGTVYRLFELLSDGSSDILTKLFGKRERREYFIFHSAVFYETEKHPDCVYEINPLNRFICTDGRWYCERFICQKDKAGKIGIILKNTDYLLRKKYNYKSSLKPVEMSKAFADAINKAIDIYAREKQIRERPEINIDLSKLDSIRQTSLVTQSKLTVDEPSDPYEENIAADSGTDLSATCDTSAAESAAETPFKESDGIIPLYRELIRCIIDGGDCAALARKNGVMLSVLADSVNEAFFEAFGDNVINFDGDTPAITEDYLDDLKGMLKL